MPKIEASRVNATLTQRPTRGSELWRLVENALWGVSL